MPTTESKPAAQRSEFLQGALHRHASELVAAYQLLEELEQRAGENIESLKGISVLEKSFLCTAMPELENQEKIRSHLRRCRTARTLRSEGWNRKRLDDAREAVHDAKNILTEAEADYTGMATGISLQDFLRAQTIRLQPLRVKVAEAEEAFELASRRYATILKCAPQPLHEQTKKHGDFRPLEKVEEEQQRVGELLGRLRLQVAALAAVDTDINGTDVLAHKRAWECD